MKKKKILICDDEPGMRESWKNALEAIPTVQRGFEVEIISDVEFAGTLMDLEKRRRTAREESTSVPGSTWGDNPFDTAAILIVDYDLFGFKKEDYITGEGVAYLARCYSRCGLIIALNQYGENNFDLTLKGNPGSFADLNMGSTQLSNQGLWGEPWDGFRPWYWPLLPLATEALERRAADLLDGHLDEPIMNYLGFPEEISETLPRSSKEFLFLGNETESVTFREFVTPPGSGLRSKDKTLDDESVARIAASRIAKWLERMVLAGQDILVDAPHLVTRFPSLLTNDIEDREVWNRTASFKGVSSIGIKYKTIQEFRFEKQDWLSRPAWFWRRVSSHDRITEVADPWSTKRPDLVFCEDLSKFLPQNATHEFVADLPSPFVRRFVSNPDSKELRKIAKDLRQVNYIPAVRFSL
jgi:hypothetical protein